MYDIGALPADIYAAGYWCRHAILSNTMIHRIPYPGQKRRLVLAIDLGTTFSGSSYAILDPDQVPEIRTVNRYIFMKFFLDMISDA